MNIKPLGDRVVIKENNSENKTKGGLMLSEQVMTFKTGVVVAKGDGIYTHTGTLVPLSVNVGDTVYFVPNTGQKHKIDDDEVMVCREGDLMMIQLND